MSNIHTYRTQLDWNGNLGHGTKNYNSYDRSFLLQVASKPPIDGSSDPAFKGDPSKYNPEELFLFSISSCHMLWYLHLCSINQIVVTAYQDAAIGEMIEKSDGSGRFDRVTLYPKVWIEDSAKKELALQLHHKANKMCFIANSCNFQIKHEALIH